MCVMRAPGAEALDILRGEPSFDLVVTDMAMPQMNGLEFARHVRADWPALPILLATGYAEIPQGGGLNLPMLGKPFGQNELSTAIEATHRASQLTAGHRRLRPWRSAAIGATLTAFST